MYSIDAVGIDGITLYNGEQHGTIQLSEIGSTYKILCRPIQDLNKPIEGVGVPIVELAKIAYPHDKDWSIYKQEAKCYRFDFAYDVHRGFSCYYKNTMTPVHPFNQLPIFKWCYTNFFNLDFPSGTTKNLI